MVIGEALRDFERRSERGELFLETLGARDAGDGGDKFPGEEIQREPVFHDVKILQIERLVFRLDDLGRPIELAQALDQRRVAGGRGFRDENVVRAPQVRRRLAERAAREQELVSERRLRVDQANLQPVLEREVLHAVIEDQRVAFQLADGVERGAHAVLVHEHDDVAERLREHVGLVAGKAAVEQQPRAVVDDAWLAALHAEPLALESAEKRRALCFVAAAEDGHPPPAILQGARKLFHDRRFAGAADGEIADRDDEARGRVLADKPLSVQPKPRLHAAAKEPTQHVEKPAQQGGALAVTTVKNDVGGELLELVQPLAHGLGKDEG